MSRNSATLNLLGNRRRQNTAAAQPTVRPTRRTNQTVKFVHGHNVILKKGMFKGYFGTVVKYAPAMSRIQLTVPETLELTKLSTDIVPSNYHFRDSIVVTNEPYMKVVYQGNNLVELVQTQPDNSCLVRPLIIDNVPLQSLNMLAQIVKARSSPGDETSAANVSAYQTMMNEPIAMLKSCNLKFPGYLVMLSDRYNGFIGKIKTFEQNRIIITKTQKTNIDIQNKIKNGPFKGLLVQILGEEPAQLTVRIEATSRNETHLMDENYQVSPITPNDVFYMDVKLRSGNFFQVNSIINRQSGLVFTGVERIVSQNANGQTVTKLNPLQIDDNEMSLSQFMPGFSYVAPSLVMRQTNLQAEETTDGAAEEAPAADVSTATSSESIDGELIDSSSDDNNQTDATDDDENETLEYSEETQESQEAEDGQANLPASSSTSSLVSSFSDAQRTEAVDVELSDDQQQIYTDLKKISKVFMRENVKVISLIIDIQTAIKTAVDQFNRKQNWNPSDGKFIAAVFFIRYMIRNGQGNVIGKGKSRVNDYLMRLIKANVLNTNDIRSSIFSEQGERKSNGTIKSMFERAVTFVNQHFGNILLDQDYSIDVSNLIPLNNAEQREAAASKSARFANIWQVIQNKIPETATRIYWPNDYTEIFAKNESILETEKRVVGSKKGKEIYDFVKNNLRQAPLVLKQLESMPETQINRLKYNALKKTYEKTYPLLKRRFESIGKRKADQIEEILNEKAQKQQKRNLALLSNKLQEVDLENENEDILGDDKGDKGDSSKRVKQSSLLRKLSSKK